MTLDEFQEKMAPMNQRMAQAIAASIYEPSALERVLAGDAPRKRCRRSFRSWLGDKAIDLASWLKGYDVTDE